MDIKIETLNGFWCIFNNYDKLLIVLANNNLEITDSAIGTAWSKY